MTFEMRYVRLDALFFLVYLAGGMVLIAVAGVAFESAAVAVVVMVVIAGLGFLLFARRRGRGESRLPLHSAPATAEMARALEADLQSAAQFRGLAGLFMGLAHDLRAPINAMVLNLELLKRSLAPTEGSKEQRRIAVIEEELEALKRSLERLLAQTSPARPSVARYDLRELLAEVGELLAPQARQQGVELEIEVPEGRILTRGSPELTKQALINLAVNGFEALARGGHLGLTVEPNGREVAIRVRDDGPGVAPEIRERIFDLHFTTKMSGAAGSTFELRLPSAREA